MLVFMEDPVYFRIKESLFCKEDNDVKNKNKNHLFLLNQRISEH